jgi:hypothetical protein
MSHIGQMSHIVQMRNIGQMGRTLNETIQEKPRQYVENPFLKKSILIKFAEWRKDKD